MKTKPKASKASRRPAKPKAEPAAPATRESLLAEISTLLDALDAAWSAMSNAKRPAHSSADLTRQLNAKVDALDTLLSDEGVDYEASELIARELGATPGEIPSMARAGRFLLWLDYVPICCIWGGVVVADNHIWAAQADTLWLATSGYRSLYGAIGGNPDVGEAFRRIIQQLTESKEFKLVPLDPDAQERCRALLQMPESAWLRAVQQRLIG